MRHHKAMLGEGEAELGFRGFSSTKVFLSEGSLRTAACISTLLGVNWFVCRELFTVEFLRHMSSIEGAFISISRYSMESWPDLTWWPLWFAGMPYVNTYQPGLHLSVAAVAEVLELSPALAYHAVTAVFYCLGPVTLFWMGYRLSGLRAYSFSAALLYSLLSPSAFLIPAIKDDIGGLFYARRLYNLVVYGKGPHIAAMALLPIAIVSVHAALTRRKPIHYVLAALAMAAVALTNWPGSVGLTFAVSSYLLTYPLRSLWTSTLRVMGTALLGYALAAPWIPPSTVTTVFSNAQTAGGNYGFTWRHPAWGALVLLGVLVLRYLLRQWETERALQFGVFFSFLAGLVTLADAWGGVHLVPQPFRFHLEMEMGLCLAGVFGSQLFLARFASASQRRVAAVACIVGCFWQISNYRRFAQLVIQPIEIETTTEYKTAKWFDAHMQGSRVVAAGSNSFWLNVFTDTPQLGGCCEQGVTNWQSRVALYTIFTGQNAGERDAEISLLWLKAFGVQAVNVVGPNSKEHYKPYWNPNKFDGVLTELWRDGDDVIFQVPQRSRSLAHVVGRDDIVRRAPIHGLDVEPIAPYVAALDDPSLPVVEMEWIDRHRARLVADINKSDHVVSVQLSYDPGWRAVVGGNPAASLATSWNCWSWIPSVAAGA